MCSKIRGVEEYVERNLTVFKDFKESRDSIPLDESLDALKGRGHPVMIADGVYWNRS